jgi:hypothetical protein
VGAAAQAVPGRPGRSAAAPRPLAACRALFSASAPLRRRRPAEWPPARVWLEGLRKPALSFHSRERSRASPRVLAHPLSPWHPFHPPACLQPPPPPAGAAQRRGGGGGAGAGAGCGKGGVRGHAAAGRRPGGAGTVRYSAAPCGPGRAGRRWSWRPHWNAWPPCFLPQHPRFMQRNDPSFTHACMHLKNTHTHVVEHALKTHTPERRGIDPPPIPPPTHHM